MAKKSDKIFSTINTGIFDAKVLFSCGFTYNELVTELRAQKCHDWAEALKGDEDILDRGDYWALRREIKNGPRTYTYFYILFRNQFDFSDRSMCTLAHECLHICQFVLPQLLDRDREFECEAYLHSHLMMQCLELLRAKKIG